MISWRKHYKQTLIAIGLLLSTSASIYGQDGDPKNGEKLFKANCTACHALDKQVVGPPLKGVVERVKTEGGVDKDWLHKWIKDNKALRASGDKYANEIFEKFNKTEMQVFPNLTDKDIDDILAYTTNPPAPEEKKPAAGTATATDAAAAPANNTTTSVVIISLLAIAALLVWILIKLRQLVKLGQSEDLAGLNETRVKSFSEIYEKYHYVGKAALGILALLAAYGVWNWIMWIGVYKGYKPEQPIYFSHKIHAGEQKIDCQLCHSSAKYGKVSEIPSMNVCMNCHRTISEYNADHYMEPGKDKAFYDGEIQKIYAATGWDPAKQVYTGKTQPVEWTRIHNMPDFVYFNHSQHVVAGEQAIINSFNKKNPNNKIDVVCKACHGKIDTMNVVQMANDFTMGWCIECHRTTEVDMNNGYNKEYFKNLHDKLKKQYPQDGGKITVDAIGGLECGKCHY
ncbi:quinol:cytochrome C oxidoreductase [Chryseobacterium carnipullorum]|uniref:Quinol:cytochrome C oxidoreductase n=2 Tax=Chryseobacterium carnipullorum TaxID=1124835 RepID=A0A1M7NJ94_CHRCU|nr:c-type cytochrome [Chryseobacterium carnipullorum]MDN5421785.1 c-type cytochrome [Chryseobacterium sp.]AZA47667.1 quinol:cytochrome C oxidoreductase [Chryseobacterium carnipullorum]AZA66990.1 quinol:cytochrome C oxidoreductase [Chryseobacterium carnipullorum]MDN5475321.1 c-type cytochrome [Chryseobacterium sp.]SHN03759.1 Cytochrome c2 [Chryseobacterium carnipullorum]